MRLVRRLTVSLLVAMGVLFAIGTFLSVRSHLAVFDDDQRRDHKVLGTALANAVEHVWQIEGPEGVPALVRSMDENTPEMRLRLVYLDAPPGDPFAPGAPRSALEAVERDHVLTSVREDANADPRIYTYVPLAVPGNRSAALEVSESLAQERIYVAGRVRDTMLTGILGVLVCGGVAWSVGSRIVGRPVGLLVGKARRIARGDFSKPLELSTSDELSQLAGEMNAMAASLDAAGKRVAAESAARLEALEQLRHADRLTTVGKLASGLAHELGTPLNVVAGRAKMIANGELEGPEEGVESARIIADQTERMTRIVRQLLDFARHRTTEKRSCDLCALARQSVTLLEPLAQKQRVGLGCQTPSEPVLSRVDTGQIQQALTNLVLNAVQASGRDSSVVVSVTTRKEAPEARHRSGHDGPWAIVEVRDHGIGISTDALPQVFDPFYTTKPVGEGTGLGLSVSYGIALDHGGWIDAESEPGKGSAFRIWLPQEAA